MTYFLSVAWVSGLIPKWKQARVLLYGTLMHPINTSPVWIVHQLPWPLFDLGSGFHALIPVWNQLVSLILHLQSSRPYMYHRKNDSESMERVNVSFEIQQTSCWEYWGLNSSFEMWWNTWWQCNVFQLVFICRAWLACWKLNWQCCPQMKRSYGISTAAAWLKLHHKLHVSALTTMKNEFADQICQISHKIQPKIWWNILVICHLLLKAVWYDCSLQ